MIGKSINIINDVYNNDNYEDELIIGDNYNDDIIYIEN